MRILSIINSGWLLHARSVCWVYEYMIKKNENKNKNKQTEKLGLFHFHFSFHTENSKTVSLLAYYKLCMYYIIIMQTIISCTNYTCSRSEQNFVFDSDERTSVMASNSRRLIIVYIIALGVSPNDLLSGFRAHERRVGLIHLLHG